MVVLVVNQDEKALKIYISNVLTLYFCRISAIKLLKG